jgi:hypothetical protein
MEDAGDLMHSGFFLGLILALAPAGALATDDAASEGTFINDGPGTLICYKDIEQPEWAICQRPVAPGQQCKADAIGWGYGKPVFKIPNHTAYRCHQVGADGVDCHADNERSRAIMEVAKARYAIKTRSRSARGYEGMEWSQFWNLMTGGQSESEVKLKKCDEHWDVVEGRPCPAGVEPLHHEAYRDVGAISEAMRGELQ